MKKQQLKKEKVETRKNWAAWTLVGLVLISIGISTSLLIVQSKPQIVLCRVKSADPITGLIELECAK